MLTFFRHIRKSLLGSGQARKYFLYAVDEFILIVAGILVAMQINNWNEERKIQKQVELQLMNLKGAIQSDLVSYDRYLMIEGFRFHAIEYLLELAGETIKYYDNYNYDKFPNRWDYLWDKPIPGDFNREFVEVCFSVIDIPPAGAIINNTAMQEFTNSGLFSELDNTELKMKITEYYRNANLWYTGKFWEDNTDLAYRVEEFIENQYQIDLRRMEDVKDPIRLIRSNKPIIIKFHGLLDKISLNCLRFLNSQVIAENVISAIDHELEKG
jgi:hypothetical protein